jgi:hypothetical protein
MVIVALLTIAKLCNQLRGPTTNEWLKKITWIITQPFKK